MNVEGLHKILCARKNKLNALKGKKTVEINSLKRDEADNYMVQLLAIDKE